MNEIYLLTAVISMSLNLLLLYWYLGEKVKREELEKKINKHCTSLTKSVNSLKGRK